MPVPDLDRTDYLLILGANPLASNGSLMTAPDMPGRLRALRARGGRLVVVDPRRSKTAEEADEHLFIRPGTDAHFLFALVHTLFAEGPRRPRRRRRAHVDGVDEVARLAARLHPGGGRARLRHRRGDHPPPGRASSRRAERAAVYGRIGTCTQEFGTLASWLVDVVNVLDRQPRPPRRRDVHAAGHGRRQHRRADGRSQPGVVGVRFGRRHSRVRGLPEFYGELPVGLPRRGDRDAGRRPDPCADHRRRQPGAVDARLRAARPRARRVSTSWSASTSTSTRPRATPT